MRVRHRTERKLSTATFVEIGRFRLKYFLTMLLGGRLGALTTVFAGWLFPLFGLLSLICGRIPEGILSAAWTGYSDLIS